MIFATTDPLVVAGVSFLGSIVLLVGAWGLSRIGNHDRDIAILKRVDEEFEKDMAKLDNRVGDLERRRR